jgi:hypothetical protein
MRRMLAVLSCGVLVACSGDTTPLPPLVVDKAWMPMLIDTTGNVMLRRMAIWVDTAHVTTTSAGYALTRQKTQLDMKMGGMSTSMQLRTEIDCTGKRLRMMGIDSIAVTVKGVAMPDSIAKQAAAQQAGKAADSTWREVSADPTQQAMVAAVCRNTPAAAGAAAAPAPAPAAAKP